MDKFAAQISNIPRVRVERFANAGADRNSEIRLPGAVWAHVGRAAWAMRLGETFAMAGARGT
jgi:hypothetical protein